MVENFLHLIRGNFLISQIQAFHKQRNNAEWNIIPSNKNFDPTDLGLLEVQNTLSIKFLSNPKFSASVILPLMDKSFLGIMIGKKLDKTEFNDLDKITLQILIQVFDAAYRSFVNQRKVKGLIFELNEKVVQLNSLIETVIEASRYEKRNVLFELSLERAASLTNASSALLQIKKDDKLISQYFFPSYFNLQDAFKTEFKIDSSFEFNENKYLFTLFEKETRNGATHFNDLDSLLLNAITRQVQVSIENEYLNEQSIEKEKMEKELSVAASIQQRILPETLPSIEGYDLSGLNIPSREVGGDYFDCIDLGNNKYALIIADVAGKGIGAALLVSTLNAALYSYLQFDIPLSEMADRLNKLIYKSSPSDKYITFFITVLDAKTGDLDVLNAGHNAIFILRQNGNLEKLEAGGVGLGMFDFGIPFTGQKSVMHSGDRLFLYTDGIPEAMNETEDEYTDEKMINFFLKHSHVSSKDFIDELVKDVKQHAGSAQQSDDITAMVLKRN